MKRLKVFSSTLLSIVLLAACANEEVDQGKDAEITEEEPTETVKPSVMQEVPSEKDGLLLTLGENEYEVGVEEIEMILENNTDTAVSTGKYFGIEQFVDGVWVEVPFVDKAFEDIGLFIRPGKWSDVVSLDRLEYPLAPGEYRIVKGFYPESDKPGGEAIVLAAPFTVE